jgi:hypothetical protein
LLVKHEQAVLTSQGLSPTRASQALNLQGRVEEAHLPLRIETALGDAYAGVWFDNAVAKFDVGVTSIASRQAVGHAVARTGLTGEVVEIPVRSSWRALMGVQEQWNKKLAKLLASGDASTGIEVPHNAVMVRLSSAISSHERSVLKHEAAAASVNVVVSVASSPSIGIGREAACEKAFVTKKARCEKTIVAGVGWSCNVVPATEVCEAGAVNPSAAQCSAGPMLIEGNETYMLTAGHCFGEGNPTAGTQFAATKVTAEYPEEVGQKEIGKEGIWYQNAERDIAEVKVVRGGSFAGALPTPVPALMAEWAIEPAKPHAVEGEQAVTATPLQMVCREGMTSGERCGEVRAVNVTFLGTSRLVETTACGEPGDSGGPYVLGTEAAKAPLLMMGTLVSGKEPVCPPGANTRTYFEPLLNLPGLQNFSILSTFRSRNQRLLTSRNERRQAAGTGKAKFNGLPTSKKVTITGIGSELTNASVKVVCSSSLGEGEASTEAVGKMSIIFNSCEGEKGSEACTVKSVGAKSEGEVVTKTLKGALGNVAPAEALSEVGLLVEPETGKKITELTAKCLGTATALEGRLAGEVSPVDASSSIVEVEFAGTSTKAAIQAITVKTAKVVPKLELGGKEALEQTYLELEFAGKIEVV